MYHGKLEHIIYILIMSTSHYKVIKMNMRKQSCPGCGAPLASGSCQYCGSILQTRDSGNRATRSIRREKSIDSLVPGQTGYISPWQLKFDVYGRPSIKTQSPVSPDFIPNGVEVECIGQRKYMVHVDETTHKWHRSDSTPRDNLENIVLVGQPRFHRIVSEMEIGEEGYIIPWMWDKLPGDLSVYEEEWGTSDLRIRKTIAGKFKIV